MLFSISFYIFSFFLSYIDCKRYRIPNITLGTLLIFLLIFGYIENQFNIYSFIVPLLILLFFVIILLIMPTMILGGGDIKYIVVVALYLQPLLFPLFLLITGLMQMIFLIYLQKIKKRKVAPMAPAIFSAVIFTELLFKLGFYTF